MQEVGIYPKATGEGLASSTFAEESVNFALGLPMKSWSLSPDEDARGQPVNATEIGSNQMMGQSSESLPAWEQAAIQVWRTSHCLEGLNDVIRFENLQTLCHSTSRKEELTTWFRSGSCFYAAIGQANGADLAATASIRLISEQSCQQLLKGRITENQLVPWFLEVDDAQPVFYFNLKSADPMVHWPELYAGLLLDAETYLKAKGRKIEAAYTVAAGTTQQGHLSSHGFIPIAAPPYLGRYPFMRMAATSAATRFWQQLLTPATRPDDPAKEVESRLRASKCERYRLLYGGA